MRRKLIAVFFAILLVFLNLGIATAANQPPGYEPKYDFLIITNQELRSAFNDLRLHKIERNIATIIVTVENIKENPSYWDEDPFNDTQAQIRNFIKSKYGLWDLKFVLLGGDTEIIPHRGLSVRPPNEEFGEDDIPADMYYGCLDGNWNNDGDSLWGEPGEEDLSFEVFVGRAPVNTVSEVNTFIEKIKSFEEDYSSSPMPLDDNITLHASWAWANRSLDLKPVKEDGNCNTNNEGVEDHVPQGYNRYFLYESDIGDEITKDDWKSEFDNGRKFINHASHGDVESYCLSYGDKDQVIYTENDVQLLKNKQYPIQVSIACYVGSFDGRTPFLHYVPDGDCIAETFICLDGGGCVAFVCNSRLGWYEDNVTLDPVAYSGELDIQLYYQIFENNTQYLGEALARCKEMFIDEIYGNTPEGYHPLYYRYCVYEWNLLGDPTLELY